MQDSTQDRLALNVSVQLASRSDAERIFSVMNDISHGRSAWGYVPSISTTLCLTFASAALLVCDSAVP